MGKGNEGKGDGKRHYLKAISGSLTSPSSRSAGNLCRDMCCLQVLFFCWIFQKKIIR